MYTFTDHDTTPSVAIGNVFMTANTGATTITTFDDGYEGQEITVIFADNNTTISHNASGIRLKSDANIKPDGEGYLNRVMKFVKSTVWYEVSRSF